MTHLHRICVAVVLIGVTTAPAPALRAQSTRKGGVPSLVDSVGYFLPSSQAFLASKYDLGEVERELTAQVERALASGLRITYLDAHMGMAVATPQLRDVQERVAKKYGLAISGSFGESYFSLWGVAVAAKKSTLLAHLAAAKRDTVT
jgi:predicted glycoside hydrolase/deacetylase ChbG (UPF0249 family)